MACVSRMKLGSQGLEVSAQGLGCMGMSAFYGPPKPEADMIALIHHAVRSGITFLDTSDFYGPFTNETLLGKALNGIRKEVELATKFGVRFVDGKREIRGDPGYVRAACEASLKRLDVDCIDLYYQHRIDTRLPIEITMGELKKLVEEGKIKYIGLSEASASTIRRAHAIHPITAVQLEWSLWTRDVEQDIVPTCRELGIGIVAYSPLGRGFLSSGPKMVDSLSNEDCRKDQQIVKRERNERVIVGGRSEEMASVGRMKLGSQGLEVSAQGRGCMGMSAFYGPPKPEADMITLIHHAVQSGITFLDTSDIYGPVTNETLLGKSLKGIRKEVELATKFGISNGDGRRKWEIRGDLAYVRAACEASLKRLDVDCINLYYQHRIDTRIPIEITFLSGGLIPFTQIPIIAVLAVQLEWSLWSRDVEEDIVPTCR